MHHQISLRFKDFHQSISFFVYFLIGIHFMQG